MDDHVRRNDRIGRRDDEPESRGKSLMGIVGKYDYKVNQRKQRRGVHVNKRDSKLQSAKHARLEYIYPEGQQEHGDTR